MDVLAWGFSPTAAVGAAVGFLDVVAGAPLGAYLTMGFETLHAKGIAGAMFIIQERADA